MVGALTRRGMLGGLVLLPSAAMAQSGTPELQGVLTARNAAAFGRFVSANEGKPVSLKLTAAPVEGRSFSVSLQAPLLLVNMDRPEKMQVSLTGGYTLRNGAFAMDWVYRVRAEGMQQGITILVLDPLDGGEVRRMRDAGVRRVAL
ncbi:hypothetical protein [Roseomonas indoligenes]|uniref:Uncharacterized protein n=1 Tax=Roseomonas indoligenes TaxID=2820811 RepID=A0A940S4R7_9PROT|nr:hypothetical protein [Pararoseomonas indoligenes]MBP0493601.1 hypothetical protein [Pararoseomonas indoligenes]